MRTTPLSMLILAIAAPAAARDRTPADPKAALAAMVAGRIAGPSVSCISLLPNTHSRIVDRYAVVYDGPGRLYVNDFDGQGCSALRKDRTLVTVTPSSQLCSGDIIRVVDPVQRFDYGSCGLGKFTPYKRAPR